MSIWAAIIPAAISLAAGAYQTRQGRKLAEQDTPPYQIPDAVPMAMDFQRSRMLGDMPGTQTMREDVRAGTSAQISAAERYGYIDPNVVGQIYGQEQAGLRNIGVASSQYAGGQQDRYLDMMGMLAGQQGAAWDWNVRMPFEYDMAAAQQMIGAGMQNIYGGIQSGSTWAGRYGIAKMGQEE